VMRSGWIGFTGAGAVREGAAAGRGVGRVKDGGACDIR
jgi:hypothetical protein